MGLKFDPYPSRPLLYLQTVKPIIHPADDLLAEVCGFGDEVVEYAKAYNPEYGRKGSNSELISEYTEAEATGEDCR
jgi:hypothetical protein